jgi:hypothetical protein
LWILIHCLPPPVTFQTLSNEASKSLNVWASTAFVDHIGIGTGVIVVALLTPPLLLATLTLFIDFHDIGILAFALSSLLR